MSSSASNRERFRCLIEAVLAKKSTLGITSSIIAKLSQLQDKCPEVFNSDVYDAMLVLKESPVLNAIEIAKLSPLFNVSVFKNYVLLADNVTDKAVLREFLDAFATAMAIVLEVPDPHRTYKARFMSVLDAKMTFKDTFSDSFTKGRATITLPTAKEEPQIRLSSDLNQAIISNLMSNQEILKNAPIRIFQYEPDQNRVIFSRGILSSVIKNLVSFQNAIKSHNYGHYIVQKSFLKTDSGVAPSN
jgi:hypothetical protein